MRELSHAVIGAGMEVLNQLKPGLDEKLYERALAIELGHRGCFVSRQRAYPVHYRGELIGKIVNDLVIVDAKVAAAFTDAHIAQMVGYLNITGLELALLLNFKSASLSWKRVVRQSGRDLAEQPDLHG